MPKHDHEHTYENIAVKKLPKSEAQITGSIPEAKYLPYRKQALRNLIENLELPGFRKGHVPESAFIQRFGEQAILEEMADLALREAYPHIVLEEDLSALGSPNIAITKLAKGNPIEFTITTGLYPVVVLPDYTTIAKAENNKPEETEVKEKDVKEAIANLRKSRVPREQNLTKDELEKEENWPAYNDAFVQSLGAFTDTKDFETKLQENMIEEKKHIAKEKKRVAILEKLVTDSTIEVPEVLVTSELAKMRAQFEQDIVRMGGNFEQYLTYIKKTIEQLESEWKPDAEKRAKLELILREIAEKEKLAPKPEKIDKELEHLFQHYQDADPMRLRAYVETMLEKEEVVTFLDSLK